jgi:MFS family permease
MISNMTTNRTVQILLVYLFIANLGASLFAPIFAIFITESIAGATIATVGFAIAISSLVKSSVQIPLSRFFDRTKGEMDEFYAMGFGSLLGICYMTSLTFVHEIWQLYALAIVVGLADGCLMASYYSLFSHHVDKNAQGFEWSLLSVFGLTASMAIGGALGGLIAQEIGFYRLFLIAAMLNSIATLLIILLYPHMRRARRKSPRKRITVSRRKTVQ